MPDILGWMTVRGYKLIPFDQATQPNSAWPSLCGRQNAYWRWFRPPLGKKWRVLRNDVGSVTMTADVLT